MLPFEGVNLWCYILEFVHTFVVLHLLYSRGNGYYFGGLFKTGAVCVVSWANVHVNLIVL